MMAADGRLFLRVAHDLALRDLVWAQIDVVGRCVDVVRFGSPEERANFDEPLRQLLLHPQVTRHTLASPN